MLQEQSKQVVEQAKRLNISSGEDVILDAAQQEDNAWANHIMEQDAPHSMGELA